MNSTKRLIYSNRTVSSLGVTVLLEFNKQEFIARHKNSSHYTGIMLHAFRNSSLFSIIGWSLIKNMAKSFLPVLHKDSNRAVTQNILYNICSYLVNHSISQSVSQRIIDINMLSILNTFNLAECSTDKLTNIHFIKTSENDIFWQENPLWPQIYIHLWLYGNVIVDKAY